MFKDKATRPKMYTDPAEKEQTREDERTPVYFVDDCDYGLLWTPSL